MKSGNNLVSKRILQEIQKIRKNKERLIVTIDGTSGSGKSSISREVFKFINDEACLINGDSLLVNYRNRYKRLRKNPFNYEEFIVNGWFAKVTKKGILNALLNNSDSYNFIVKRNNKQKRINYDFNKKIIIIEGCFVSHDQNFGSISDLKVYLTMSKKDILQRRQNRKENLKKRQNNSSFTKLFDEVYKNYLKCYGIIKKSDLKIRMFYEN